MARSSSASASICAIVVAAMLARGATARAQTTTSARALIEHGISLREHGDDRGGLEQFSEAYAQGHGAEARAQMALAEQALGMWVEAEAHLREALDDEHDPWIASHRRVLDGPRTVISQHVAQLDLTDAVAGAEVRVRGRVVGTLPFAEPVHLAVTGSEAVRVEVRAPGYQPYVRNVALTAGQLAREPVQLEPLPPEPVSAAPASSAPPHASEAPMLAPERHVQPIAPRRSIVRSPFLWTGVGVVLVAAAVIVGVLVAGANGGMHTQGPCGVMGTWGDFVESGGAQCTR